MLFAVTIYGLLWLRCWAYWTSSWSQVWKRSSQPGWLKSRNVPLVSWTCSTTFWILVRCELACIRSENPFDFRTESLCWFGRVGASNLHVVYRLSSHCPISNRHCWLIGELRCGPTLLKTKVYSCTVWQKNTKIEIFLTANGISWQVLEAMRSPTSCLRLHLMACCTRSNHGVSDSHVQIQAGQLQLEHVEFDLGALLETLVEVFTVQCTMKGVELGLDMPGICLFLLVFVEYLLPHAGNLWIAEALDLRWSWGLALFRKTVIEL